MATSSLRLAYEQVGSLGCHDFIIAIRDGAVEVSYERRCPDCGVDFDMPREVLLEDSGAAFWRNPSRTLVAALNRIAKNEIAADLEDAAAGRWCHDDAPSERHPEAAS